MNIKNLTLPILMLFMLTGCFWGNESKKLYDEAMKVEAENGIEDALKLYRNIKLQFPETKEAAQASIKIERYELFDSLKSMAITGKKFSKSYSRNYDAFSVGCGVSNACYTASNARADAASANEIGYTRGEITRKSQRIIYELRQTGLTPSEIMKTLDKGKRYSSSVYGGCCEGAPN